jgi:hypothetical protein
MRLKVHTELKALVAEPESFLDLLFTIWFLRKPLSLFDWWIKKPLEFPMQDVKHVLHVNENFYLVVFREPFDFAIEGQSEDAEIKAAAQKMDSWLFQFHVRQKLKMLFWSPMFLFLLWSGFATICLALLLKSFDAASVQTLSGDSISLQKLASVWSQTYYFWGFLFLLMPMWWVQRNRYKKELSFITQRKLKIQWLVLAFFLVVYSRSFEQNYFSMLSEFFALGLPVRFVIFGF